MGRWTATAALSVIASAYALSLLASAAEETTTLGEGRDLYEQHCEVCHGAEGKGDGPLADELRVHPADLTQIAQSRGGTFPEVEVREIIDGRRAVRAHGKSGMPIWGRVFGGPAIVGKGNEEAVRKKLDRLVEYLQSIQTLKPKSMSQL
jgi:mono/diheme cytochrome c family protein